MAIIYGQVGCLTDLLNELKRNGIDNFKTMDDIQTFRNNYNNFSNQIRGKQKSILEQEIADLEFNYKKLSAELSEGIRKRKQSLKKELAELETELEGMKKPGSFLRKITTFVRKKGLLKRKLILENSFEREAVRPFVKLWKQTDDIKLVSEDKKNNAERWIDSYSAPELKGQEKILAVFKENRNLFYGAEGEEKAVVELSKLPDTYTVINDYRLDLSPPIYDRRNDDRIYSAQLDHIVAGPTGIYLIETKNWSEKSVKNLDLFSPVKQIRRHSFAMFVLLNQSIEKRRIKLSSNHWGDRKVSPKNIVLLMNNKPHQQFQYVSVLSLKEVTRHITRGKVIFGKEEVESLVNALFSWQ